MLLNAFSESGIAIELKKLREEELLGNQCHQNGKWSVVILKNMKKFVENCRDFRWNSFWMDGLRGERNADEAVVTVFT